IRNIQNVLAFEIARVAYIKIRDKPCCICVPEDPGYLLRCPDNALPFLASAVYALGRLESAIAIRAVAKNIVKRLNRAPAKQIVARDLKQREIDPGELSVVVEHFLEMRHKPYGIHRVPMKSAADLIIEPAAGHFFRGMPDHSQSTLVACPLPIFEQKVH